jgi:glucose-6-phosphate 1-dehydrogenase
MTININQPASIVIFGGTGDLAKRKLIPAFYNLFISKNMPNNFRIILIGRKDEKIEVFRKWLLEGVNEFSRTGKANPKNGSYFLINFIINRETWSYLSSMAI